MLKKGLFKDYAGNIFYRKQIAKKRYCIPAHTKSDRTANSLVHRLEAQVIKMHYDTNLHKLKPITFAKLKELFLKSNPNWPDTTRHAYTYSLNNYGRDDLSIESQKFINRHVRVAVRYAINNNYDGERYMPKGSYLSSPRERVASQVEIEKLLKTQGKFGKFIKFIYYTGVRRSEACSIRTENYRDGYIDVWGKNGHRLVKVTNQARKCLDDFDYKPKTMTRRFKRLTTRLGIENLHLHDLRKTFGTNFLKQGGTLTELATLLGDSMRVTERNYAFLKVADIKDFKL
jgi:integrase